MLFWWIAVNQHKKCRSSLCLSVTVCIDVTIQKEWKIYILRSFSKVSELESCVVQYQKFHLKKKNYVLCYSCAHEYCLSTIFRHLRKQHHWVKTLGYWETRLSFSTFSTLQFHLKLSKQDQTYWHHVKPQKKPMKNTSPSVTMNTFSVGNSCLETIEKFFLLRFYYCEDFFLPSYFCK